MTKPLWQPMADAPRDGSFILAEVATNRGRFLEYHAGRLFVIRHEGLNHGHDLGWAVYPGLGGAGDHDFTRWSTLPPRDSDGSPQGGDGEAGSVHDSAGPQDIAQPPTKEPTP